MAGENPKLTVKLDGKDVALADVFEFVVDIDLDQPDMAVVSFSNVNRVRSSTVKLGDELEISGDGKSIFKGEVVGIEPTFDYGQPSRVTVRALNRMHRLSRGRKSRTFQKQTDQDIVSQVCRDAGLTVQADATVRITHDHVYQHNQTDLQFLRQRAARIDYEVVVEDKTLYFRPRRTDRDSGVTLTFGDGTLDRFRPRISGANQVNKVVVRGWDPAKRKEIIGTAEASASLSGEAGPEAAGARSIETVETDRPIYSQQEANAMAKGLLKEKQMTYITGDVMCDGIPELRAGIVVKIDVQDPRFNGKYYVASCKHRFIHTTQGTGGIAAREAGYRTLLQVMRDSQSEGEAKDEAPRANEQR